MHPQSILTLLFLLCSPATSLAIFAFSSKTASQNIVTEAEIDRLRVSGLSDTAIAAQLTHETRLSPSAFAPRGHSQKPQKLRWFRTARNRASRRVPSAGYLAFLSRSAGARGVDDPRGGGRRYVLGYSAAVGSGEGDVYPSEAGGGEGIPASEYHGNDNDDGEEFTLVPAQEAQRERRHRLGSSLRLHEQEYL